MKRLIELSTRERSELERPAATCVDARLRTRVLIIIHTADGWSRPRIAGALRCDLCTVSRVRRRWTESGMGGVIDGRVFNGTPKVDADFTGGSVRVVSVKVRRVVARISWDRGSC